MNTIVLSAKTARELAQKTLAAISKQRNLEWENAIKERIKKGRWFGYRSISIEQAIKDLKNEGVYSEIFFWSYGKIETYATTLVEICAAFPSKDLTLNIEKVATLKSWVK